MGYYVNEVAFVPRGTVGLLFSQASSGAGAKKANVFTKKREVSMAIKKRRLGKGLDSLVSPSEGGAARDAGVRELPPARIELNPLQPRKSIDEEALEELAASIRNAGVLQPVVVRPASDGMYELVMGERRLRAARRAGLEQVPAIVRDVDDDRMLELAMVENVQREDLNPIEKARALDRMMEELGLTQAQVAEKIGLKRPTVGNLLRLLELPEEVRQMVSRGTLSGGHARALLSTESSEGRIELAHRVVREGLSVREVERLAACSESEDKPRSGEKSPPSPHVQRLQAVLSESLHTDVRISSRGEKGRIIIHFNGHEEFERLVSSFTDGSGLPV